jgi:hypothetical protein
MSKASNGLQLLGGLWAIAHELSIFVYKGLSAAGRVTSSAVPCIFCIAFREPGIDSSPIVWALPKALL